jgi:hypothetical protein
MPVEENAVDTPEVEAPEVEVEETEVPEVPEEETPEKEKFWKKGKKEKKPKPTPGKGRQDKGKGKALGKEGNMGKAWLETAGARFIKAGHSQRNVVVKAGKEAGMSGQEALQAFRSAEGTFEERIASLFD